jgi:hypothetical protein
MRRISFVLLIAVALLLSNRAYAHHSFAATYFVDQDHR